MADLSVLVVDDDEARFNNYKKNNPSGVRWHYVEDPFLAIGALKAVVYDVICLDHDLGTKHGEPVTIMPLVSYIARTGLPSKTKVFIHSMNTVGAKNMHSDLSRLGNQVLLVPGAWLKPDLIQAFYETTGTHATSYS